MSIVCAIYIHLQDAMSSLCKYHTCCTISISFGRTLRLEIAFLFPSWIEIPTPVAVIICFSGINLTFLSCGFYIRTLCFSLMLIFPLFKLYSSAVYRDHTLHTYPHRYVYTTKCRLLNYFVQARTYL